MNSISIFAQAYQSSRGENAAFIAAIMLFYLIIIAISYVVYSLLMMQIFKKAGIEGWKAWVPFYNYWILLEMGGQKGFWAILLAIPPISIVAGIFVLIAQYHIGLRLQKSGAFVLWAIFVPIVWFIWLAVDNSTWHDEPIDR